MTFTLVVEFDEKEIGVIDAFEAAGELIEKAREQGSVTNAVMADLPKVVDLI